MFNRIAPRYKTRFCCSLMGSLILAPCDRDTGSVPYGQSSVGVPCSIPACKYCMGLDCRPFPLRQQDVLEGGLSLGVSVSLGWRPCCLDTQCAVSCV